MASILKIGSIVHEYGEKPSGRFEV